MRLEFRLQTILACVVQSGKSGRGNGGEDREFGQGVHGGRVYAMIVVTFDVDGVVLEFLNGLNDPITSCSLLEDRCLRLGYVGRKWEAMQQ